ncbi:chemotaxis-specific protein-glutamate methyltransferase CheB [Halobacteriovorax sp.]|uniref:chemotaxis-specific protein-glutamate methyltransferase CheB n=1 Tax=Halobacteriovorax sp. TaxID=2020862 RepID=UPI0035643C82
MEDNFFSGSSQSEYYLKINFECFVCVEDSQGKSCGTILSNLDLKKGSLEDFLSRAEKELNTLKSMMVIKAVGSVSFLRDIKTRIEEFKFRDEKLVQRDDKFEVVFYPNEGKLRVTKEEAVVENKVVNVLVVDDSKTIRNLLTKVLSKSDRINVVATAEKPSDVEELIKEFKPDVITLDIHMPEMNGVELLKIIQPKYKIPAIMITSVSIEEGPLVLDALESGAFDYIQKPKIEELSIVGPLMIEKVLEASKFKTNRRSSSSIVSRSNNLFNQDCSVVIGSSTGGTTALKDILCGLPSEIPPMLVVQHIPAVFSKAFADRLNGLCPFTVSEAIDGESVERNHVYIAPGGQQMKIKTKGDKKIIQITDDAPVNRFKPSVDYMFQSFEAVASKENIIAVILTGMGKDGAKGIKKLKDLGALTIAQSEESCVVFGMPKEAISLGGATEVVHKENIAEKLVEFSQSFKRIKAS